MCDRCTRPKSYLVPKKEDLPKREKPEKLEPSEMCPIHGHIDLEYETQETPRTHKRVIQSITDYDENVTIFVAKKSQLASESCDETENSIAISKKIRDSIEFTSMTHSARHSFNFKEIDQFD